MGTKRTTEKDREDRIDMEIVVDAYDAEERAMGWYNYLQDTLEFPFDARCVAKRASSPLKVGDDVEVIDLAAESESRCDMLVTIRWEKDGLAVPLSQLKPGNDASDATRQAAADWAYWVKQGYEF